MLSLYIHFPFCLSKCIYCDFGSKVIEQSVCNYDQFQKDFLECCKRQLYYFANKIEKIEPLNTIYFGGGTPSLLKVDIVNSLIHEVKNLFSIEDNCEITLEANPTSFEFDKFKAFKQAGINRISLGVQSLDNNNLSWLGRRHSAENAVKAIQEIFLLTVSYPDHLQADKYQEGTCVYIVTPTNGTPGINFIAEYW